MIREIDGRTWRTPLTEADLSRRLPTARLVRTHYRGLYHYEGTGGYEYYRTRGWLPVTGLQRKHGRRWKTWMVDDPLHWDGMREAVADLPDGRILVAGLGLGLMLHHMATEPRFTAITVVEIDPDVIALITPTLPVDPRVTLVRGDFYDHLARPAARTASDGVLWDLAVGTPSETWGDMIKARVLVDLYLGVPLVCFGVRRQADRRRLASCPGRATARRR